MFSTGIAGQVFGTKCALASSNIMCKWLYKFNTKKYVFAPPPAIVLCIVVTFLAAQKIIIYLQHIRALAPTLPEGWLLKW